MHGPAGPLPFGLLLPAVKTILPFKSYRSSCPCAWRPAAACGKRLFLLPTGTGNEEQEAATEAALQQAVAASGSSGSGSIEEGQLVSWQRWQGGGSGSGEGVVVLHRFPLKHVTWHGRGDYFATVAPTGNTQVGGWSTQQLHGVSGRFDQLRAGWLAVLAAVGVQSGWAGCACKLHTHRCCVPAALLSNCALPSSSYRIRLCWCTS